MSSGSGDTAFSYPGSVGWSGSVEEALQIAKLKQRPVAVYFATKDEFSAVGESADTIKQFAAAHDNSLPSTVFELPKLIDHLRGLGVVEFVKVANTKENRALASQYEAGSYSMVLLTPDGAKIFGGDVTGNAMNNFMVAAKSKLTEWQAAQPQAPK